MKILPGKNMLDSMMMAVIPIAICHWIVDSILNIFFYNKYNVLAEIFSPACAGNTTHLATA